MSKEDLSAEELAQELPPAASPSQMLLQMMGLLVVGVFCLFFALGGLVVLSFFLNFSKVYE